MTDGAELTVGYALLSVWTGAWLVGLVRLKASLRGRSRTWLTAVAAVYAGAYVAVAYAILVRWVVAG